MKILLTQLFALCRSKGALGFLFAGSLIVAVSCENIQRNDQPVTESGSTEIIPNPDGTATVPSGSSIANCAANGLNSVECLLAVGSYFYGIEYGGKIPLKDSNVTVNAAKQKTLDKGWYPGTSTVTFSDPQLKASNIRSGISIFGILGTATTTRPSNCDIASFPIVPGSGCSLSRDLYIYDSQNGGRAANCNLSSPSPLQNNCWVDLQSKFYMSTELKTPPLECTSGLVDSDNPIASSSCWIGANLWNYTASYGGRGNLCATNESLNTQPCWISSVPTGGAVFVSSNLNENWCAWNEKTTRDCRARINVSEGTSTVENKSSGYVYKVQYGGRNENCSKDGAGYCWTAVDKDQLDDNLTPDKIKAGVKIFGVLGKFRGEGSWKSGAHRDSFVYPLAISDESYFYAGTKDQDSGLPDGYREVPWSVDDDGTSSNSVIGVDRSSWGNATCGIGGNDSGGNAIPFPSGYTSWTLRARMSHCAEVFGVNSLWDGTTKGNSSQGKWKLVLRTGPLMDGRGREVWLDDNTGMLWSSLVSNSINWCKAVGASTNDPNSLCTQGTYQNQTTPVSACLEELALSSTDIAIDSAGKGGLNKASSLAVRWRIPTVYDYEVAEYNGVRFVLPDLGKALGNKNALYEWTGTINSSNSLQAWLFSNKFGDHAFLSRSSLTAGVRCIGRVDLLN